MRLIHRYAFRMFCCVLFVGFALCLGIARHASGQTATSTSPLDSARASCHLKTDEEGKSVLTVAVPGDRGTLQFTITYDGTAYSSAYTPSFPRAAAANQVFQENKAKGRKEVRLPPPIYDAAHFTATALAVYQKMDFKPHRNGMQIRVTQEDGGKLYGTNSYHDQATGIITLNIKPFTQAREMRYVLAHEIFHELQHRDVTPEGTSSKQRRWWMEATADYAAYLTGAYDFDHVRPGPDYFKKCLLKYQRPADAGFFSRLLDDFGDPMHEYLGAIFLRYLVDQGVARGGKEGETFTRFSYFQKLWKRVTRDALQNDFSDSDIPERVNAFLLETHGKSVTFQEEYARYVMQKLFLEDFVILPRGFQPVLQTTETLAEDAFETSVTVDGDDALAAQVSTVLVAGDKPRRVSITVDDLEDKARVYVHVGKTLKASMAPKSLIPTLPWKVEIQPGEQIFVLGINSDDTNFSPQAIKVRIDAEEDKFAEIDVLLKQLQRLALRIELTVEPDAPEGPYEIVATVAADVEARQAAILQQIRELIRDLGCTPVIDTVDTWKGPSKSEDGTFEAEKPGDHTITLVREIFIAAADGRRAAKIHGKINFPATRETITAGIALAPESLAGSWNGNLVIVGMPLIEGLDESKATDDLTVQACAAVMKQLAAYKGKALTLQVTFAPPTASAGKMTMSITPPKDTGAAGNAQVLGFELKNGVLSATLQQEGQLMTMTGRFTPHKTGPKITGWTLSGGWRLYGVSKAERVEAMNGTWTVSREGGK